MLSSRSRRKLLITLSTYNLQGCFIYETSQLRPKWCDKHQWVSAKEGTQCTHPPHLDKLDTSTISASTAQHKWENKSRRPGSAENRKQLKSEIKWITCSIMKPKCWLITFGFCYLIMRKTGKHKPSLDSVFFFQDTEDLIANFQICFQENGFLESSKVCRVDHFETLYNARVQQIVASFKL